MFKDQQGKSIKWLLSEFIKPQNLKVHFEVHLKVKTNIVKVLKCDKNINYFETLFILALDILRCDVN